ncbi:MAG: hypothetical protein HRU18_01205 [Pseudoalteromonas sp.]|uniref:hypothetical protein n=1 Tax=Pseudoalteromonas sp. TaxID=53249 RepID=UPI001D8FC0B1|nr:hypothetical protein [Pseudoalteromonas sp.]NRA76797.1 hypothetical protein [Pseudoalteromonas sp.]
MSETNMFAELGQNGTYYNQFGMKQNIILVHDKENGVIWCKEDIPLGFKVYDSEDIFIGEVEGSQKVEKSVGNIYEIYLKTEFKAPVTITEVDLTSRPIPQVENETQLD